MEGERRFWQSLAEKSFMQVSEVALSEGLGVALSDKPYDVSLVFKVSAIAFSSEKFQFHTLVHVP